MLADLALRFVIGGAIVSVFAAVAQVVRPRTFSGLFGAAPSVAIATLALAFARQGSEVVAIEARWMLVGTAAMLASCSICVPLCRASRVPIWLSALAAWLVWLVVALGLHAVVAR